jgi:hypothetical protein
MWGGEAAALALQCEGYLLVVFAGNCAVPHNGSGFFKTLQALSGVG